MEEDRGAAMARRLERAARRARLADDQIAPLLACYEASLARRATTFTDPRHPEFLHSGRTALILLEDVGIDNVDAVAIGLLHDSRRPALRAAADEVERLAGTDASALFRQLPDPGATDAQLIETLVSADPVVSTVALAERLDHARHLHLAPRAEWTAFHRQIENVYLPLAGRGPPPLARRFRWWTDMFQRRFLT